MIPLFDPPKLTGAFVQDVLESRHLTTGPQVEKLREEIADYWDTKPEQIVLANSATACFQAIYDLLAIGQTAFSAPTWPLLPEIAKECAEASDAMAYVKTDIGGRNTFPWQAYWNRPGKIRVRDACHTWAVDKKARFSFASFYPTKPAGGAEGGAMWCESEDEAGALQELVNCGFKKSINRIQTRVWDRRLYGRKSNMTDVAAAVNREAFEWLEVGDSKQDAAHEAAWKEIEKRGIGGSFVDQRGKLPYLLQMKVEDVPDAREYFAEQGIATGWHFPPAKLVTLPCYVALKINEIAYIVERAERYLERDE